VPLEHIRGSEDPDATLYRQMEQYVLDHYPNPTRKDCLSSEILRLIVNEPETLDLQDPKYQHIMECAECLREVIGFREARQTQVLTQPTGRLKRVHRLSLLTLGATAGACLLGGIAIGTHIMRDSGPSVREVRSEVLDLSRDATARGIENSQPALLMKDANQLVVELPPLSPPGPYRVTLRHDDGDVLVSADGTASTNDGKVELHVSWNLAALPSGTYRLGLKGTQDSAAYLYPIQLR
jgi:hypothetical protein